jgi:hypothetical protein
MKSRECVLAVLMGFKLSRYYCGRREGRRPRDQRPGARNSSFALVDRVKEDAMGSNSENIVQTELALCTLLGRLGRGAIKESDEMGQRKSLRCV